MMYCTTYNSGLSFRKKRRENDNLEQQAQALFKAWFVDFEPFKDGKFVESELGMIPEGWKVTLFSNIVNVKGGGTPRTNINEYWNGDIPFFTPKDITQFYYTYTTEKYLTHYGIDNCNSTLYPSDTIIITARGTVGKVRLLAVPMAMNQSCYALLPCKGIPTAYAFLLIRSLVYAMKKKSNGAVFDAITTKDFAEKIILPKEDVLNEFSKVISPIFEKINYLGKECNSLISTRDALLPKLMSGELKINDLNC